jgi:glycerate 2-kinase
VLIKNIKKLQTSKQKKIILSILESGLEAGMPDAVLKKIIHKNKILVQGKTYKLDRYDRVFVVAVGKAAFSMTCSICKYATINGGIVVIPENTKHGKIPGFQIIKGSHPIPDKKSIHAAKSIISFLDTLNPKDFVIFLFSGGTSSLTALPDCISIKEKQVTTRLLLRCGATINEINCIRKHLSKIKGGKLARYVRCKALSLIMSDVIGNDLSSIVSGITYGDNTTFSDAKKILEKYHIENLVPSKVMQHIEAGITKKQKSTHARKIENYIICDNNVCLEAMNKQAKKLGLSTILLKGVTGNISDVSKRLVRITKRKHCLIFGGETTVTVTGSGKGGRNQELALRLVELLAKNKIKAVVACMGTDGVDGNTDAAGAISESGTPSDKIRSFLENNDSYHYFKKYGGHIITGPTQTNLADIGVILRI